MVEKKHKRWENHGKKLLNKHVIIRQKKYAISPESQQQLNNC